MDNDRVIELVGSVTIADDVKKRIATTGIRGLSVEKAKEFGLFDRISNFLCAMHTGVAASYKVYEDIYLLLCNFGVKKNEIVKACNDFDKAFDKFVRFWTDYYKSKEYQNEVDAESDELYHKIMRWAQLPESWQLGDEQHSNTDDFRNVLQVNVNDSLFTFGVCTLNERSVGEDRESWCVTKFEPSTRKQICVEDNMDKASALMVAKRLSDEDRENVYTASIVRDFAESKTEVTPFKAFMANKTVGHLIKQFKNHE